MNIDALERIRGEVDALHLQMMIVDAINIFCGSVLEPVGALNAAAHTDFSGTPMNKAKHEIAAVIALRALGVVASAEFGLSPEFLPVGDEEKQEVDSLIDVMTDALEGVRNRGEVGSGDLVGFEVRAAEFLSKAPSISADMLEIVSNNARYFMGYIDIMKGQGIEIEPDALERSEKVLRSLIDGIRDLHHEIDKPQL